MCDDKDLDAFNAVKVGGKPSKVLADDVVFSQRLVDICNLGVNGTCTPEPIPEPDPEPDGRLTIPITNRAPVRIDPAVWPVVARGDAGDRLDSGRCRGAAIVLRKHEDGRTVCEAAFVIDGREDIVAGKVGVPSTEVTDGFLALQVKAVAEYLNSAVGGKDPTIRRATAKALASLPAVDL